MRELNLPYSKFIDYAVPGNRQGGVCRRIAMRICSGTAGKWMIARGADDARVHTVRLLRRR